VLTIPTNVSIRGQSENKLNETVDIIEKTLLESEFDYTNEYFPIKLPFILSIREFHDVRSLYRHRSWRDVTPHQIDLTTMELRFHY